LTWLRRAKETDAASIARLHRRVVRECLPYLPDLHTTEEDLSFFSSHFLPNHEVWVWDQGGIAGYCGFRDGWVAHLYVSAEHQRKGIGSALLRKAKEGYPQLRLWVFQRNEPAITFYERRGFNLVEQTDGTGNEEHEPDALYQWSRDS